MELEEEEDLPLLEGDPLLEQAVQLYLELRVIKRPPESAAGASRKALKWLEYEAATLGRVRDPAWDPWLRRAFLDVDGDVEEQTVRRRQAKRPRAKPTRVRAVL